MTRENVVVIFGLLSFSTVSDGQSAKKDADVITREERAVIDLVNAERKKENLPPLTANLKLAKAARSHSAQMAKLEKMEHELEGKTAKDRVEAVGYLYKRIGENIAAGQKTPEAVMDAWMNSEHHKENIMRKEFTEIGIGIALGQDGKRYWTQVFGTPRLGKK